MFAFESIYDLFCIFYVLSAVISLLVSLLFRSFVVRVRLIDLRKKFHFITSMKRCDDTATRVLCLSQIPFSVRLVDVANRLRVIRGMKSHMKIQEDFFVRHKLVLFCSDEFSKKKDGGSMKWQRTKVIRSLPSSTTII